MPRKGFTYSKKSKTFTRKPSNALATAKKALREVKKLSAASGPHLKDIDSTDVFDLAGAGTVQFTQAATFIATGDDETDRTGDFINVRSVTLDGAMRLDTSVANSQMHIALVVDTQQAPDTSPSYSDIFESTSCPILGGGSALYKIRKQEDSLGRYRVLWSKLYNVKSDTPVMRFNHYHAFKNTMKVEYNGTGSGDIQKNGIYVVARQSETALANMLSASWTTRIRFDA